MKRNYGKAIKKVAKQNGVSAESVYYEISKVIKAGYNNPDPAVQEYWRKIAPNGEIPSPEKVIEILAKEIKKNKY
ncbi:MAG: sporulation initiation factor Spo0A [Oscillospiraceae bacterium]|nr:sporulation initiation factor Spo0A [Oscillospiraceae bacterium]